MKNILRNIAFSALILGSLTSCVAYTDGYAENTPYYNASYSNGNYYAPNSYYGNGGYYGNDGYYYRENMNYLYDNNVPYYNGANNRRIYVQKQVVSQRPANGLQNSGNNRIMRNDTPGRVNGNVQNNGGFRNTQSQNNRTQVQTPAPLTRDNGFRSGSTQNNSNRIESPAPVSRDNSFRSEAPSTGGFRNTATSTRGMR